MPTRLYSNPGPQEIDDWFDAAERGGTPLVGLAAGQRNH
jgi:hypothetical protein